MLAYGQVDATAILKPHHLTSFLSRLVLPFWFRLTQVVLEKRPLNGCVCFIIELTTIIMNSDILVTDVCRQHKTSYYDNFDNQQLQDQVRVVCDARKIFLLHRNRQRFCKNSE